MTYSLILSSDLTTKESRCQNQQDHRPLIDLPFIEWAHYDGSFYLIKVTIDRTLASPTEVQSID